MNKGEPLNRKVKSVNFNLDDPFEKELLDHSKKYLQFATYIKRLIQRDLDSSKGKINHFQNETLNGKESKQIKQIDRKKLESFGI
ncbi:hypothetical protein IM538_18610 [Cytobacillus suaedae]|nr:hypothetical protein IM538_18610 [Cytobacillus suaedae]